MLNTGKSMPTSTHEKATAQARPSWGQEHPTYYMRSFQPNNTKQKSSMERVYGTHHRDKKKVHDFWSSSCPGISRKVQRVEAAAPTVSYVELIA